MIFTFFGPHPLEHQLATVLRRLSDGEPPAGSKSWPDVKEETGRHGARGEVLPGTSQNDEAVRYLADEMACSANTPAGGAIILGIADDGGRIGTELDPQWLRHRIWELTERVLTVDVREGVLGSVRLLVLRRTRRSSPSVTTAASGGALTTTVCPPLRHRSARPRIGSTTPTGRGVCALPAAKSARGQGAVVTAPEQFNAPALRRSDLMSLRVSLAAMR